MNLSLGEPHGLVSPDFMHLCINKHELCLVCCYTAEDLEESGQSLVHFATFLFVFAGLFHTRIATVMPCRVSNTNTKSSFDILYVIGKERESQIGG